MTEYILGLDPSNKATAYCLIELPSLKPIAFGFMEADEMLNYVEKLPKEYNGYNVHLAIEGIENLGMTVGKTVFDTCMLVGRLLERGYLAGRLNEETLIAEDEDIFGEPIYDEWIVGGDYYKDIKLIYRRQEKMNLCGTMCSKDKDIRQALIDRFARGVPNGGKGSKAEQGWFYGFRADIWSAYAVATTYYDLYLKQNN
jgi:hypothetical protein